MKLFVAFTCLLAVVAAIEEVTVLKNVAEVGADSYNFAYELDNGVAASESGTLTGPEESIVAHGSYKFTSPEGESFNVEYVADAAGYQPTGAHIPQVPVLIQKALDYLATAKPYVEKS